LPQKLADTALRPNTLANTQIPKIQAEALDQADCTSCFGQPNSITVERLLLRRRFAA
jgi:hypothetical protein